MTSKIKPLLLLVVGMIASLVIAPLFQDHLSVEAGVPIYDEEDATVAAVRKASLSVVSITVKEEQSKAIVDPQTKKINWIKEKIDKGKGSGFIISADGYILTNRHVVESARSEQASYRVTLSSGQQYYARLIGKDPLNDLAVLKIYADKLPFVELGDSDALEVGRSVIAIGYALGRYQNSATKGIVSGLGRSIVASGEGSQQIETLDNIIQTDAEINPGNSGGPLLSLDSKVVGINVAIDSSGSSIGFAIPINDAKPIIRSIREKGKVVRARLGVRHLTVTAELAADNKLSSTYGAWIKSTDDKSAILENSPAQKIGLKDGDIIIEAAGLKLEGKRSLLSVIQLYDPGQKFPIKVRRQGQDLTMTAILDEF